MCLRRRSTLGIAQGLQFGGLTSNQKTPNQLSYSGNLVASVPTRMLIRRRHGFPALARPGTEDDAGAPVPEEVSSPR